MNIAIIGTGNIGGALATKWALKGHTILLGVNNKNQFKGRELLNNQNTSVSSISEAVSKSEVVLIAIPPTAIFEVLPQLNNVTGKIVIDATNSVRQSPEPYKTVYHCLMEKTQGDVVKCFNSTGFENILNPTYQGNGIDMFMAGESDLAKKVVSQLAIDAGFGSCMDFGKSDKVELLEKFALCWINLAIMQGQGRNIAFKLVRR
jgi:predicted dinucleotide-binding enzyme